MAVTARCLWRAVRWAPESAAQCAVSCLEHPTQSGTSMTVPHAIKAVALVMFEVILLALQWSGLQNLRRSTT